MNVLKKYFDFLLPELREFSYSLWIKVMAIYKIILPLLFLSFYLVFQECFDDKDFLELLANITLLIIGIENGIGVFSWMISETFTIYTLLFTGLQCYIRFFGPLQGDINQEKQNRSEWFIIFQHFNVMMFKGFSWINLATMVPGIFMLVLITICTCQIQLFMSLIRRKIKNTESEIFSEYAGNEEIECSICMEEIKQMEKFTELPCHHIFHYKCFGKWRIYEKRMHSTCPICRQVINFDNIHTHQQTNQQNTSLEIEQ